MDIGTGALSHKKLFVDFYSLPEAKDVLTREHMLVYNNVKAKIRHAIARNFNIEESWLHLTSPTFFSKLTNDSPRTENDIYWNIHVDKVRNIIKQHCFKPFPTQHSRKHTNFFILQHCCICLIMKLILMVDD